MPQEVHLSLLLRAIVDPDGNQAIFSRALVDADCGLRERTLKGAGGSDPSQICFLFYCSFC